MRLIKHSWEHQPKENVESFPAGRKGFYVLYKRSEGGQHYNVVYVGIGRQGIKKRLKSHFKSEKKGAHWTHFSAFEVQDDILPEEIEEFEGLLRNIYRLDSNANALNVQRRY